MFLISKQECQQLDLCLGVINSVHLGVGLATPS